ncbi:hypothetical protein [Desulfopila aestuarii]|uniref:Alpha/beta hydrolase n=1 Tax=Desulfopila aestuarii DSM 18488 TaxID=1121416 RepID=A0A1M7YCT9_9BACT|nr:hypothetical protein [Desulfopila aestuarii]SHO50447.1 hypothetical protein SAMN02745220_03453 [Desulfopila aestuarii DSM 18488]
MNILLLPGINQKTEKWGASLISELALPDSSVTIQRYGHWDGTGGEQCMMMEAEIERLRGVEVDLLIGKSVGVVVGLLACQKSVIAPKRAVFIGTPVTSFIEENIDLFQLVDGLSLPALYIQQKDDVVGTSGMLCERIGKASQTTIVEVPGNNHQYKDVKQLTRHIKKWLGEQ